MVRRLAGEQFVRSREHKWLLYERLFPPSPDSRILDVGASKMTALPWENWFLRRYPYPGRVTAVVLPGETEPLRAAFPEVTVVEADGRALPFGDHEFDVVHSNAVIEHVGPRPEQRRFMAELVRVGGGGFVTTPNRWFPLESHSLLPLVHWLPRSVSWTVQNRLGHPEGEAWLLGARSFRSLVRGLSPEFELYRQRMAGLTATLVIAFRGS